MFSSLGVNIERRIRDNNQFTKFLVLLNNNWDHISALSVLEKEVRREASKLKDSSHCWHANNCKFHNIVIPPVKLQGEVSIASLPAIEESTNSRMSENMHSKLYLCLFNTIILLLYFKVLVP